MIRVTNLRCSLTRKYFITEPSTKFIKQTETTISYFINHPYNKIDSKLRIYYNPMSSVPKRFYLLK